MAIELLHFTDQEAGIAALDDAPRLSAVLNALQAEDIGNDGEPDTTFILSSGDLFIPGTFFSASEVVYGTAGIADIEINNQLGVQAVAFGNHEFDQGPEFVADLISGEAEGEILGSDFDGTAFPYLSGNLDFEASEAFGDDLIVDGGAAPQGNTVTSSVVLEQNGERIGVVGATPPTLPAIASPGDVGVSPQPFDSTPTDAQLDALAAVIQEDVDALLAANPDLNKVVLLAHMQQISIEFELAERLENVDIIIAGGSNTRLVDDTDRLRPGDTDQGEYPSIFEGADGNPVAVINTDGNYKYVGRLVAEFTEDGVLIPESIDPTVSGAYATDDQGVADLGAEGLVDPEVQQIVDEIRAQIEASESNVFGVTDVFLDGRRSEVRTEETNLGNLTADANLAIANEIASERGIEPVLVSIKNAGGIRAPIGQALVPAGGTDEVVTEPPEGIPGVKPEGGISQNDIETTLAFNNGLTLITLTAAELKAVLEHGVAVAPEQAGQFPQIAGLRFSFDPDAPEGSKIQNAVIVDESGETVERIVSDGAIDEDAPGLVRVVTLNFLAEPRFDEDGNYTGGGDGYPFPNTNTDPEAGALGDPDVVARANVVQLTADEDAPRTGAATFAEDGSEQDALAEYLFDTFRTDASAFDNEETTPAEDTRIINLGAREFDLLEPPADQVEVEVFAAFEGEGGEGASEVVAVEGDRVFVTNGTEDRIDVFELSEASGIANPDALVGSIALDGLPGYDGVQSVAVSGGVVAAAVRVEPVTRTVLGTEAVLSQPGIVALFDATSFEQLSTVEVGNLPDQLTFSEDGETLFVAGEGEKNADSDIDDNPLGTVAIIDVADPSNPVADVLDFSSFNGLEEQARAEGIRIQEGFSFAEDVEPEYITVSPDGSTLFVSLQEANAIAKIDVETRQVIDVWSTGSVDFGSESALDPLDEGEIGIKSFDGVRGLRMPDAIAAFETGGTTYVATANEGDSRDFDEARVSDLVEEGRLDPAFLAELVERGLVDFIPDEDIGLERLEVSTIDGDTDGDGDIDELVAFGTRSFSIFDGDGNLVFDSGSDFEEIIARLAPVRFNNDDGLPIAEDDDNRSDAKGPEPEAIAIGEISGETYAFIGLERDSGIMIYNVSSPEDAFFVDYIPGRFVETTPEGEIAAQGPEVIEFIPADESVSGTPQIAVSYEISGTTFVYDVAIAPDPVINEVAFVDGEDSVVDVEIFGEGLIEYSDITLLAVESAGPNVGEVLQAVTLEDTDVDGFDVLSLDDVINGTGAKTLLLVKDFLGDVGQDLDTDNDGDVDEMPFMRVVDGVTLTNGEAEAVPYADVVLALEGIETGDGDVVGGASRFPNGVDTDSADDWIVRTDDQAEVGALETLGEENAVRGVSISVSGVGGGSFADDDIVGSANADDISGFDGNDTLSGAGGPDILRGGAGQDLAIGGEGDDQLFGEDGDDELNGNAGNDSLDGGEGNDVAIGGTGLDTLNAGDGDDFASGQAGDDLISLGAGNDFAAGGTGDDRIFGEAGSDQILGSAGNDFLTGGDGDDFVSGQGGDDEIVGNAGNDELRGGGGDDFITGQEGNDTASGGGGADEMFGGLGDDLLLGNGGNDRILGSEGNDSLTGDNGNDTLNGQDGDDRVIGNDGDDDLAGGAGDDFLSGQSGDDTANGGNGDDEVFGGIGNDVLSGGGGADRILGGTGDDVIDGGAGDDTIEGQQGADRMTGGSGADTFGLGRDFGTGNVITDFDSDVDTLLLIGEDDDTEVELEDTDEGLLVTVTGDAVFGDVLLLGVEQDDLPEGSLF